jgi:hypothetical protein
MIHDIQKEKWSPWIIVDNDTIPEEYVNSEWRNQQLEEDSYDEESSYEE